MHTHHVRNRYAFIYIQQFVSVNGDETARIGCPRPMGGYKPHVVHVGGYRDMHWRWPLITQGYYKNKLKYGKLKATAGFMQQMDIEFTHTTTKQNKTKITIHEYNEQLPTTHAYGDWCEHMMKWLS
jgi:hypothetical protein